MKTIKLVCPICKAEYSLEFDEHVGLDHEMKFTCTECNERFTIMEAYDAENSTLNNAAIDLLKKKINADQERIEFLEKVDRVEPETWNCIEAANSWWLGNSGLKKEYKVELLNRKAAVNEMRMKISTCDKNAAREKFKIDIFPQLWSSYCNAKNIVGLDREKLLNERNALYSLLSKVNAIPEEYLTLKEKEAKHVLDDRLKDIVLILNNFDKVDLDEMRHLVQIWDAL